VLYIEEEQKDSKIPQDNSLKEFPDDILAALVNQTFRIVYKD